jgi:hypothetical protein
LGKDGREQVREEREKGGRKMGRERERKRERRRAKGRERGSQRGRESERGKEEGRRIGGSCSLHFFKGTAVQYSWSEFFAPNSSFGGPKRETALNKFEFGKS